MSAKLPWAIGGGAFLAGCHRLSLVNFVPVSRIGAEICEASNFFFDASARELSISAAVALNYGHRDVRRDYALTLF
ncbi:hypothetical protein [Nitrobacter sp. JJSN]|uniref:hypothetical protein n=1 Tax=Nitrobacter sp. JJSN TaxID=3453033 RepID=UPI003F769E22